MTCQGNSELCQEMVREVYFLWNVATLSIWRYGGSHVHVFDYICGGGGGGGMNH